MILIVKINFKQSLQNWELTQHSQLNIHLATFTLPREKELPKISDHGFLVVRQSAYDTPLKGILFDFCCSAKKLCCFRSLNCLGSFQKCPPTNSLAHYSRTSVMVFIVLKTHKTHSLHLNKIIYKYCSMLCLNLYIILKVKQYMLL